ncbi:WD40-repeat-containing domain protein [Microdochium trichocladiopsis]|uniref:WD40-repeat-containing domain protein n=1 Tax=Microdochium trichocladiopsis TaxID=1682393 RepID=A0A9P8YAK5_9PEZI|nr:WD40-repeat-containing domain protein [Microdochium trichocladiopsis]KAH7034732.1 WD40-repeat-containing domain protein [Microdochium trichocladiopsis]
MDIHRCRFVPYPPSAINAVAFSYPALTKANKNAPVRLAIGRANGDIEIWNPLNGAWHHESTLHGGKDRSIDGLVWVNEPDQILSDGTRLVGRSRLFSIGYTATVTEWDLEKGRPKKQATGMHGDIWCLAARPLASNAAATSTTPQTKQLVAGTIDGSLVLYSIEDGDLQFERIIVKSTSKKTKMVSIAFQSRNVVVVGCSDSAIRVYDIRNGSTLRTMTLGSDLAGGAKDIIVWSVKCLAGKDIVSGDSTGQVCIWDGKSYTQAQRLQSHKQDVLSLATSADGTTIVSGGMDRKTVLYQQTSGSGSRWGKVWHRRYHNHDVKTMASFEGLGMSVVVSGGPDANPIVLPLKEAGMEYHRTLSALPQNPPVRSAVKSRYIVSWWDRQVHVWQLRRNVKDLVESPDADLPVSKNRRLLARILVKGEANITSATVSADGSILVVATTSDVKAFHLDAGKGNSKKDELKISKVDIPEAMASNGAKRVDISPDGQWICMVLPDNSVYALRIERLSEGATPEILSKATKLPRLRRNIPKHVLLGGLGQYDRSITHVAFSPDSKMIAVADLAGYIDTWVLQAKTAVSNDDAESGGSDSEADETDGENDITSPKWQRNGKGGLIPKLNAAPTVLSFSSRCPTSLGSDGDEEDDYRLLAVTARPQILIVNPLHGAMSSWSRRNPTSRFPVEFRNIRDLVKGALWAGERVWLYGNSFLFMFDTCKDVAEPEDLANNAKALVAQGIKRKRGGDSGAGSRAHKDATGPTRILRHVPEEGTEELNMEGGGDPMDTDATSGAGEDDDDASDSDDSEDERRGELALLRTGGAKAVATGAAGANGVQEQQEQKPGLAFWHTFKYRPILGIVPLSGADVDGADHEMNGVDAPGSPPLLEVALIERPLWDVDLTDRYYADGERER